MKKTILITGAGTGIGKDAAFALAQRGHRVLATTQSESQADSLKAEATTRHVVLEVFKLDITAESDRERMVRWPKSTCSVCEKYLRSTCFQLWH
jgi:short-subunit dehydrogenase